MAKNKGTQEFSSDDEFVLLVGPASSHEKILAKEPSIEDVAAEAVHQVWAHWMNYMLSPAKGCFIHPASKALIIPKAEIDRWKKLAETPFDQLTDAEKASDYEVAKLYLKGKSF